MQNDYFDNLYKDPDEESKQTNSNGPKKKPLVIAGVVAVVLVAGLGITTLVLNRSQLATEEASEQTDAAVQVTTVALTEEGMSPETVVVTKDQTIQWVNQSQQALQVTAVRMTNDALDFGSPSVLLPNESYAYTFAAAGDYSYTVKANRSTWQGAVNVKE